MAKKKWYMSKTIWASMITAAIGILTAIDKAMGTSIMDAQVVSIILAIAGALGVYGRKTAKAEIK